MITECGVATYDTTRIITPMKKDWLKDVKSRMKELGLTQADLAPLLGVQTRGAVGHYLSDRRDMSPAQLQALAQALDWSVSRLLGGAEPVSEVSEQAANKREIPLINYIQAGSPTEVIDDYAAGAGMDTVVIYGRVAESCGKYCFALKVAGESMLPDFRPGDVVVVDPGEAYRPGDVVVAKLDTTNEATLKKYRSRGHDSSGSEIFELVPLNDDYPTITVSKANPGHVIGPVIEHHRRFR